ncbi:hypothetical protein MMC34_008691, partial [Xylographa carneopallida]|nr:hypothetical protein [Xylographa carneopallida]
MSDAATPSFGSRLLDELRVRRSLNSSLFRHLCRSLLPAAQQQRQNMFDPIVDMVDDKDAADGRLLELYTGMLLHCQGHTVRSVGGARNDGGVDVLVDSAAPGSGSAVSSEGGAVMVQCKQYRDTPVNVDVLVQLLGGMNVRDVQHGLLVTNSEVTEGVRQLERYLQRRQQKCRSNGDACSSCGAAARPVRAQVWDRSRLIALLDQHAAGFIRLRDDCIQRLLDDGQLMHAIRQRRGTGYCIRHAICDPLTFPHAECVFGCRPMRVDVAASTPSAADARPRRRAGVRSRRIDRGFHFSHPYRQTPLRRKQLSPQTPQHATAHPSQTQSYPTPHPACPKLD